MADLLDHGGDVGVGRRLTLDKPGLEACLGAIDVDALKKDTMKMEIGVRRRLYLIVCMNDKVVVSLIPATRYTGRHLHPAACSPLWAISALNFSTPMASSSPCPSAVPRWQRKIPLAIAQTVKAC